MPTKVNPMAAQRAAIKAEMETGAAPLAADPAPPAAAPPAADPAPAPAAPAAAPKYADGTHVQSANKRLPPGKVTGAPTSQPCYLVTPDDGSEPYTSPETETAPFEEPQEDPMQDDSVVPAATAEAHGLKDGATLGECNAAAKATATALETERAEARTAALDAAGMKGDLQAVMAGSVVRGEGQSWTQAVAAHKATYPSAYHSPAAQTPPPAGNGEGAKPPIALVRGSAPIPEGGMPGASGAPPVKSAAARNSDDVAKFRAQFGGARR